MEYKTKTEQKKTDQKVSQPKISLGLLFTAIAFFSSGTFSEQRLQMDGTAIIGNKELPKVLHIVPWKASEPLPLSTPEYKSVLDESLQPIERASFKREIEFYELLHAAPAKR